MSKNGQSTRGNKENPGDKKESGNKRKRIKNSMDSLSEEERQTAFKKKVESSKEVAYWIEKDREAEEALLRQGGIDSLWDEIKESIQEILQENDVDSYLEESAQRDKQKLKADLQEGKEGNSKTNSDSELESEVKVADWSEEASKKYKMKIAETIEAKKDMTYEELKKEIRKATIYKKMATNKRAEEVWWDRSCEEGRKKYRKIRRKFRDEEVSFPQLKEAEKEYIKLREGKKKEFGEKKV